jgi:SHS2 domain-containing protein
MPYKFLDDISIADAGFEARGKTLEELFASAASAVTNTMVEDLSRVERKTSRELDIRNDDLEMLLFHFLQELIFYKDAEQLLFNVFELSIEQNDGSWHLHGRAFGERISPERHELLVDVKAVSLHKFKVEKLSRGWKATVIVDV